ncbi:MAG: four helix bundle protein [Bacteroidales bacterium]|nr:four helix bundle protein [Bacteroidales bacterium]
MTPLKSYRELTVWQKSMDLVKMIYTFTASYPKAEMYGLTSQIRRASVSVTANIAEGQARNTPGEFHQLLGYSRGSLAEVETLILLSRHLDYLTNENSENLLTTCAEINKMLHGLSKSLSKPC